METHLHPRPDRKASSWDCIMNRSHAIRAELHKNGWEEWLDTPMALPAPLFYEGIPTGPVMIDSYKQAQLC